MSKSEINFSIKADTKKFEKSIRKYRRDLFWREYGCLVVGMTVALIILMLIMLPSVLSEFSK